MASSHRVGTRVRWNWGTHWAIGRVAERFTGRVSRTIKGSKITRNATPDDPAYLIEQEDGGRVLKSHSEVDAAR